MILNLRLWVVLCSLRLKLALLLIAQVWVVDPGGVIFTLQLPVLFLMQWALLGEHYVWLVGLYAGFLVARIVRVFLARTAGMDHDAPYVQELAARPRLAEYLEEICREFHEPEYRRIAFVLSNTPWRQFGCDAAEWRRERRTTVVSVGCLGIYSMFDLRCELAHALVRARSWLVVPIAQSSLSRAEQLLGLAKSRKLSRGLGKLPLLGAWAGACARMLYNWNFMADLAADWRVAQRYGTFAVSS